MLLFRQMSQNEPLPVSIQRVLTAPGIQLNAASRLQRLQQQVHLSIVAQGFKVSYALYQGGDGLFVDDAARAEGDCNPEAFLNTLL